MECIENSNLSSKLRSITIIRHGANKHLILKRCTHDMQQVVQLLIHHLTHERNKRALPEYDKKRVGADRYGTVFTQSKIINIEHIDFKSPW